MKESVLAQRMKQARKEKGWTQERLSIETGVTQCSISLYERGVRDPVMFTAICIADALGVSLDWLAGREEK